MTRTKHENRKTMKTMNTCFCEENFIDRLFLASEILGRIKYLSNYLQLKTKLLVRFFNVFEEAAQVMGFNMNLKNNTNLFQRDAGKMFMSKIRLIIRRKKLRRSLCFRTIISCYFCIMIL